MKFNSQKLKEIFGENKSPKIAIIKFFAAVILFGISFYFISIQKIICSYIFLIIFALFLSKKVYSKYDFKVLKISLINSYSLFIGAIFLIGTYMMSSGFFFLFKDPEMIKYLLILSFTLAGITFIGVTNKEIETLSRNLVASCLMFCVSGFAFLLYLASLISEPNNPINGANLVLHKPLTEIGSLMGVFGGILFSFGLFLMIITLLLKINKIAKENKKDKTSKEKIHEFFGTN